MGEGQARPGIGGRTTSTSTSTRTSTSASTRTRTRTRTRTHTHARSHSIRLRSLDRLPSLSLPFVLVTACRPCPCHSSMSLPSRRHSSFSPRFAAIRLPWAAASSFRQPHPRCMGSAAWRCLQMTQQSVRVGEGLACTACPRLAAQPWPAGPYCVGGGQRWQCRGLSQPQHRAAAQHRRGPPAPASWAQGGELRASGAKPIGKNKRKHLRALSRRADGWNGGWNGTA